jgi:hypothetical protein
MSKEVNIENADDLIGDDVGYGTIDTSATRLTPEEREIRSKVRQLGRALTKEEISQMRRDHDYDMECYDRKQRCIARMVS